MDNCTKEAEEFINSIVAHAIPKSVTLSEIMTQSEVDPVIKKVVQCVKVGCWTNDPVLKPFELIKDELTYKKGMLLKGTLLVIPVSL